MDESNETKDQAYEKKEASIDFIIEPHTKHITCTYYPLLRLTHIEYIKVHSYVYGGKRKYVTSLCFYILHY